MATPVIPAMKPGEGIALFPQFLPDGRRFLNHTVPSPGATGTVYAGSLDSKTSTRVMEVPNFGPAGNSAVQFVEPGYVLFSRNRTLYAQAFDPKALMTSGDPVAIAQNVIEFSVSNHGTVVYRPNARIPHPQEMACCGRIARENRPVRSQPHQCPAVLSCRATISKLWSTRICNNRRMFG
jgi:hypothetical protein